MGGGGKGGRGGEGGVARVYSHQQYQACCHVNRGMTGEKSDFEQLLKIFEREINARERASSSNTTSGPCKLQSRIPISAALMASNSGLASTGVTWTNCNHTPEVQPRTPSVEPSSGHGSQTTTNNLYMGVHGPVLLQTAYQP